MGNNQQDEAGFWKQKYLEQVMMHTQVVAALMRNTLIENALASGGVPSMDEPRSTGQSEAHNGVSRTGAKT